MTRGEIRTSSGEGSRFILASWLDGDGKSKSSVFVFWNLFLKDKLLNLWLKVFIQPTHIFLFVSGVFGLGELSFSMSFGTDEAVDMLSPVSSVSPVL